MKCSICVFVNKFEKLDENGLKRVDIMASAVISKSIKGDNLVKMHLSLIIRVAFASFLNKFENIDENGLKRVDVMVSAVISKSIKGDNKVKMFLRVVAYIQNVALVMVNKYVKIGEESYGHVSVFQSP